jgi:coenzyme F420-reducing hydrogenase delta subunit
MQIHNNTSNDAFILQKFNFAAKLKKVSVLHLILIIEVKELKIISIKISEGRKFTEIIFQIVVKLNLLEYQIIRAT